MKKLLLIACLIVCCRDVIAQKVVVRKNKVADDVTEEFQTIIEGDKQIKQGYYHAFYNKKVPLATGKYENDKKAGVWHYFDRKGKLMQNYDYDENKLLYEDPEGQNSGFRYQIDDTIKTQDKATQPVRLGGRYFGYIPYVNAFKMPTNLYQQAAVRYVVNFELLISPMGRVADMQVRVRYGPYVNDETTYSINLDLLADEDKTFIPATFNNKPTSSRVTFMCYMDGYGIISMY